MLKIKFANNQEQEILPSTTVYPSGSSAVRSRMELHMAADAMTFEAFETLMSDTAKTATLHIIETDANDEVLRDIAYTAYTIPAQIGKQRVDVTDYATGAITSEMHLVVVLEQLTYIEQQLKALGISIG